MTRTLYQEFPMLSISETHQKNFTITIIITATTIIVDIYSRYFTYFIQSSHSQQVIGSIIFKMRKLRFLEGFVISSRDIRRQESPCSLSFSYMTPILWLSRQSFVLKRSNILSQTPDTNIHVYFFIHLHDLSVPLPHSFTCIFCSNQPLCISAHICAPPIWAHLFLYSILQLLNQCYL